jgi:hypothetical protein
MSTRTGKIARLPFEVRETLNRCLRDGHPGKELVGWLNSLPEVKTMLTTTFGGRALTEQNLSEWKQGGYRDWLRQQESVSFVRELTETAAVMSDAAGTASVSDRLSAVLAVELAREIQSLLEETTDPQERWAKLGEALQRTALLRHEDHSAGRLRLEQERWEAEQKKREEIKADMKRMSPLFNAVTRETLRRLGVKWPPVTELNPTESDPIQPNQTGDSNNEHSSLPEPKSTGAELR